MNDSNKIILQSLNGSTYTWNFGDGSSSNEANPIHAYAAGNYTVELITMNTCGADTLQQVVTITTVGTEHPAWAGSFRLFPNPAAENIVWEIDEPTFLPEAIRLLDAQGRVVRHWKGTFLTKTLSTAGLPPGVYFLEIQTREQRLSQKIVLKN